MLWELGRVSELPEGVVSGSLVALVNSQRVLFWELGSVIELPEGVALGVW